MKHPIATLVAAAALALCGAAADAQQYAATSKSVHLRAGPGRDYPVVAVLPPEMQVVVYGCVPSYTWCDVEAGPDRGWVYSGNLLYSYDNGPVVLPSVAAVVGIGITAFIIDDYWGRYYTNRSWWPQRQRWYRVGPPNRDHRPGVQPPRPGQPTRPGPGQRPGPGPRVHPGAPRVEGSPQDTAHLPPPQQQRMQPAPQQRVQPPPRQQQPAQPHPSRPEGAERDRR
ncbi:MAG TPA: SH3 domain-containing protein [Ramlibacter sp.]